LYLAFYHLIYLTICLSYLFFIPNDAAKLMFDTGKAQVKENNLEKAIACYQEAIRLQGDYVAAYNQFGNVLQILGKTEEAIADYQRTIQIKPDFTLAHRNLGGLLANER
jgi:tetratricopeptide (TPR) repeat protein